VYVRVLGPLEIDAAGETLRLTDRQCHVMGALVLDLGKIVSDSQLLEILWGCEARPGARVTLRSHVMRLRRSLGSDGSAIARAGQGASAGYVLRLEPHLVDAHRFRVLLQEGHRLLMDGELAAAVDKLEGAAALWRGPAFAELLDMPFAAREVRRLNILRRTTHLLLDEVQIRLGYAAEVVSDLEILVEDDFGDEWARQLLAVALYITGKTDSAAAICYHGLKYASERGLDSPALRALQQGVLRHSIDLQLTLASARQVVGRPG